MFLVSCFFNQVFIVFQKSYYIIDLLRGEFFYEVRVVLDNIELCLMEIMNKVGSVILGFGVEVVVV